MKKAHSMKNCDRFATVETASKYPSEFRPGHFRDQREKKAIARALEYIPKGSRILDIPCGTGRLTKMLYQAGYTVTSADRSIEMVEAAEKNFREYRTEVDLGDTPARYCQEDIVAGTTFKDQEFDAVICHRLFHHLIDPNLRLKAIRELKRITKGIILLSFFNSFSLSAGLRSVKNRIKRHKPTDRLPISAKTLIMELRSEGIEVIRIIPMIWGISPLCIAVART